MFDEVTLLYDGRQIYSGPTNAAKVFFVNLGFICPNLATTAGFLTSLTNHAEHIVREDYELRVPRTPEDFEYMWRTGGDRAQLVQEIRNSPQKRSTEAEELPKLRQAREAEKRTGRWVNSQRLPLYGDTHTIRHTGVPLTLSLI